MSWEQVYDLLVSVGGKAEIIDPAALDKATAQGHGDRQMQIRIATIHYQAETAKQRKEAHGQNKWFA
jgi:hypothetical protein